MVCHKRIGCNYNVMRQSACLMINPITVDSFAALFNCTLVDRESDYDSPDLKLFILVGFDRSTFVSCLVHRGSAAEMGPITFESNHYHYHYIGFFSLPLPLPLHTFWKFNHYHYHYFGNVIITITHYFWLLTPQLVLQQHNNRLPGAPIFPIFSKLPIYSYILSKSPIFSYIFGKC